MTPPFLFLISLYWATSPKECHRSIYSAGSPSTPVKAGNKTLSEKKTDVDKVTLLVRYCCHMIVSFKDEETELIWKGRFSKRIRLPSQLREIARRKLRMIAAATTIETLRVPPNNRLEALRGDRTGQWSIRINDQWRVCFRWQGGNASDVEIADYH